MSLTPIQSVEIDWHPVDCLISEKIVTSEGFETITKMDKLSVLFAIDVESKAFIGHTQLFLNKGYLSSCLLSEIFGGEVQ